MPDELSCQREVEAQIRQVLEASALVKFARQPVTAADLEQWIDDALAVVDTTAHRSTEPVIQEGDAA